MNDQDSPKLTKDQLLEQIVDEFTREVRSGVQPDIQSYKDKFPAVAHEIDDLLSSVAMIEELKRQKDSKPSSRQANLEEVARMEKLGDYRIVRELGRGGMGIVLEAIHESLGRRVALKVLPSRSFEDEKSVQRFEREAQAAATLHHTNIVPVFGVGQDAGYNYYVMEYIKGFGLNEILRSLNAKPNSDPPPNTDDNKLEHTLLDVSPKQLTTKIVLGEKQKTEFPAVPTAKPIRVIERSRLPNEKSRSEWTANIGAQVADALAYAHEQGTLHRDLKPANLLLDQVDTVWLTDFGLAKNTNSRAMTLTGEILGTPQYMAPESFEGKYDERSETYCLGLTLYELATLKPAFNDGTTAEIVRSIMSSTPVEPRKINPEMPVDLNTIILKAIAREPSRRYQTATAIREDLRSFLADRPIQARKAGVVEQAWRWSRRNPLLATLSLVSLLLLAATATTATAGYLIAQSKTKQLAVENEKLARQKLETDAALDNANINQVLMEIEKQRAEANLDSAAGLVDQLFANILDKGSGESLMLATNGLPVLIDIESEITREDTDLLTTLAEFYEDIARKNSQSAGIQVESVRAFRRVGNAYHMTGHFRDAIRSYDLSIRECKELIESDPESLELGIELAQTRCQLGSVFRQIAAHQSQVVNNREHALENFNSSLGELGRARDGLLSHANVNDPTMQFELASIHNMIAAVWPRNEIGERLPDWPTPEEVYATRLENTNAAIEILDQLVKQFPQDIDYQTDRVNTYRNRAEFTHAEEQTSSNRDLQLVFDECDRLLKEHPDHDELKLVQALALQADRDSPVKKRMEQLRKSIEICKDFSRLNRADFAHQFVELVGRIELAQLYTDMNDQDLAWENVESAMNLMLDIRRDGLVSKTIRQHYETILEFAKEFDSSYRRREIQDRFPEEFDFSRRRPRPRNRR